MVRVEGSSLILRSVQGEPRAACGCGGHGGDEGRACGGEEASAGAGEAAVIIIVKLRRGSGKDRQRIAPKAKGLKA